MVARTSWRGCCITLSQNLFPPARCVAFAVSNSVCTSALRRGNRRRTRMASSSKEVVGSASFCPLMETGFALQHQAGRTITRHNFLYSRSIFFRDPGRHNRAFLFSRCKQDWRLLSRSKLCTHTGGLSERKRRYLNSRSSSMRDWCTGRMVITEY